MTASASSHSIKVVGNAPRGLRDTAADWSHEVACFLRLPVPVGALLCVHNERGVSRTRGSTIELFVGSDGRLQVDQLPHELAHLIAGPSSRFLAEGIAVHAAAELALGPPCWPCYRVKPDTWVAELRREGRLPALPVLAGAAKRLHLAAGLASRSASARAWLTYVTAGSFVGWLWGFLGDRRFWEGYAAGSCWTGIGELERLERKWLSYLPKTIDEMQRHLLERSMSDAAKDLSVAVTSARDAEESKARP